MKALFPNISTNSKTRLSDRDRFIATNNRLAGYMHSFERRLERNEYARFAHGQVASCSREVAANASLFTEGYFSEPLTTYAQGYRDRADIEAALKFIAPEVKTNRRFEYATFANAEEWFSDSGDDDARPIKGNFKEVEYTSNKVNAATLNRGLRMLIDLDQVTGEDLLTVNGLPGWQTRYTAKITRRLRRNSLRRGFALLSAAANNTGKTWNPATASVNPDGDVDAELALGSTASGIRPNRVIYGDTSWSYRRRAHEGTNTAAGFAAASRSEADLATYLGVEKVYVSRERYQSTAAAKSEIVSNLVVMFNASDEADTEDPANIKRFTSEVDGGGGLRVYVHQLNAKVFEIVVEHYELTSIVSTLGIRQFTVSPS